MERRPITPNKTNKQMKKTIIAMAAACAALAACSKEPVGSAIVTPSEEGV